MHYKITVQGRVQGVWFRKYTQEAALSYGIKGFVQNSGDGSVYVEAEGSRDEVDRFLEWLHQGSPLSRVENVVHHEGKPVGFSDFEIRR